jgi:non-heme chloroperoxidase
MLKTRANPAELPIDAFDKIRACITVDRTRFLKDLTTPFFGANRDGSKVTQVCEMHSGSRGCRAD